MRGLVDRLLQRLGLVVGCAGMNAELRGVETLRPHGFVVGTRYDGQRHCRHCGRAGEQRTAIE
jgi:hypothetical protein